MYNGNHLDWYRMEITAGGRDFGFFADLFWVHKWLKTNWNFLYRNGNWALCPPWITVRGKNCALSFCCFASMPRFLDLTVCAAPNPALLMCLTVHQDVQHWLACNQLQIWGLLWWFPNVAKVRKARKNTSDLSKNMEVRDQSSLLPIM